MRIFFCFLVVEIFTIYLSKSQTLVNYDSLRVVLEKVYNNDQEIRRVIQDSIQKNSWEFNKYIGKLLELDSANQKTVIPIIDKFGLLPKSKIGDKASEAIFFVIQHSNIDLMEKYFPAYDSLSRIGEANRKHAALMEDRLLMWKGLKQKYGTQAFSNENTNNKMVIWPISEPNKVDSLRKIVGFQNTIKEYAEDLGAIYDPNLKLPEK